MSELCRQNGFPNVFFTFPFSGVSMNDGAKCGQIEDVIFGDISFYANNSNCQQQVIQTICRLAQTQQGNCTYVDPNFTSQCQTVTQSCVTGVGLSFVNQAGVCTAPLNFFNNPTAFSILNGTVVPTPTTSSTGSQGGVNAAPLISVGPASLFVAVAATAALALFSL